MVKIVSIKELAEVWIEDEVWRKMTRQQKDQANKEVKEYFDRILMIDAKPFQPERLNDLTPEGDAKV